MSNSDKLPTPGSTHVYPLGMGFLAFAVSFIVLSFLSQPLPKLVHPVQTTQNTDGTQTVVEQEMSLLGSLSLCSSTFTTEKAGADVTMKLVKKECRPDNGSTNSADPHVPAVTVDGVKYAPVQTQDQNSVLVK
jgi:hypothetical protein